MESLKRSALLACVAALLSFFLIAPVSAEDGKTDEAPKVERKYVEQKRSLERTPWSGVNPFSHHLWHRETPAKRVKGKVVDAEGKPLEGVALYDWQVRHRTFTDKKGEFSFDAYTSDSNGPDNLTVYLSCYAKGMIPQSRLNRPARDKGQVETSGPRPWGNWYPIGKLGDIGTITMVPSTTYKAKVAVLGAPQGTSLTLTIPTNRNFGGSSESSSGHWYPEFEKPTTIKATVGDVVEVEFAPWDHGQSMTLDGEGLKQDGNFVWNRDLKRYEITSIPCETMHFKGRVADLRNDEAIPYAHICAHGVSVFADAKGNFDFHAPADQGGSSTLYSEGVYWCSSTYGTRERTPASLINTGFALSDQSAGYTILRMRPIVQVLGTIDLERSDLKNFQIAATGTNRLRAPEQVGVWSNQNIEVKRDKLIFRADMVAWGSTKWFLYAEDEEGWQRCFEIEVPADLWSMNNRYEDVKLKLGPEVKDNQYPNQSKQ